MILVDILDEAYICSSPSGYITPFVMESLLGSSGGYLLMTMLMMALMSTGSGEVMAISSIIVYDIYKTHINPFRYKRISFHKYVIWLQVIYVW